MTIIKLTSTMDLLDIIQENLDAMIIRLRHIETIEYRKTRTKEELIRDRKFATIMLKSIIQRKADVIQERKFNNN